MTGKTLHHDFTALLTSIPGAPERERILSLLLEARCISISDEVVSAVSETLSDHAYTVEHNLDFLMRPAEVTWFEWNEKARRVHSGEEDDDATQPDRVGLLLTHYQDDPFTTVGTVAWRLPDGTTDHAPALFSWNEDELTELAGRARDRYSKINAECWARMMTFVLTHVPEGFVGEMEELEELRDDGPSVRMMEDNARREVSAEALFIMGTLLMLQTSAGEVETSPEGAHMSLRRPDRKFLDRFKRPGFFRSSVNDGYLLSWRPPETAS